MPGHFVDSKINQNLEIATEYFKALVSNKIRDKNLKLKKSAGSIGFIPININFTMDGLSGIKIYNELSVDTNFLPKGYTDTTNFIVTGVDHKIQNGDWETTVKLTLIPTTEPITDVITSSISITTPVEEAPKAPTPPSSPGSIDSITYSGTGYDPIKSVIRSVESSNYDSLFPSTTYKAAFGKSAEVTTIAEVVTNTKNSHTYRSGKKADGTPKYATVTSRAVGRYQNLGALLFQRAKNAGLDPNTALYNKTNQEIITDYHISSITTYFTSNGSQSDLESAVTKMAATWSSLPSYKRADGVVVGNVVTGNGNVGYYSDGINSAPKKITVKDVVKGLIQTYKNLNSGKNPNFIPTYI